jgi:TRAP-type C4-dicarboxylate transport system permease small subunit
MPQTDLRRSAASLRRWCTLLCIALLVIVVLELAARAGAFELPAEPAPPLAEAGREAGYFKLGLDLLFSVPTLLQILALWSVRRGLADVAAGALFTPTLSRLLRQVGLLLFLAAAFTLVLAPWLHGLAAERFPRMIEFDVANLVLGSLGLTLTFLAKLFDRAVDLQRELDDIF